ncbi:MAG: hypothetical protein ABSE06_14980 [Anaerolineaceae bacterium]
MKNQSPAIEQLDRYIRARYPAIASHEESRVMASILAVAERRGCRAVTWTCTQGLQQLRPEDAFNDWHPDSDLAFDLEITRNEVAALEEIYNYNEKAKEVLSKRNQTFEDVGSVLFVIKDIHGFFGNRDRGLLARGLLSILISLFE